MAVPDLPLPGPDTIDAIEHRREVNRVLQFADPLDDIQREIDTLTSTLLARAHGGRITVESQVGEGMAIRIRLLLCLSRA